MPRNGRSRRSQAPRPTPRPDLVIHVGDYHYRENACPAGNAGCAGSPWGYGWDAWEADVFAPARRLFAAAPWIVVRGNHESCNRAGQGWWRFLDPRPLAPHQDCNVAADDGIGDYSEPYAVPLVRAQMPTRSSSCSIRRSSASLRSPASDPMHIRYRAQFEQRVCARRQAAECVLHEPPPYSRVRAETDATRCAVSGQRRAAIGALGDAADRRCSRPTCRRFCPVTSTCSKSSHSRRRSRRNSSPATAATGSTRRSRCRCRPARHPRRGRWSPALVASNRFGFMTMERDGPRWRLVAHDVRGAPMIECVLFERRATCGPASP